MSLAWAVHGHPDTRHVRDGDDVHGRGIFVIVVMMLMIMLVHILQPVRSPRQVRQNIQNAVLIMITRKSTGATVLLIEQ